MRLHRIVKRDFIIFKLNNKNDDKEKNKTPESNLTPNSDGNHSTDSKKAENKDKDTHTTFDVKKSPMMSMYQRSYETFSLNKKMTVFSTDDFVIHDTTTLN